MARQLQFRMANLETTMADELMDGGEGLKRDGRNGGAPSSKDELADGSLGAALDPNDEVPVPVAMWPSELDERAQVVEALRGNGPPPRTDTQVDPT